MAIQIQQKIMEDVKTFGQDHKKITQYFQLKPKHQQQQPNKTKRNNTRKKKRYNNHISKFARQRRIIYIQYQTRKLHIRKTLRQMTLLENKIWDTND